MKTCKIIPVRRKPVYRVLPNNKPIAVPSQLPLSDVQLLNATMQAKVYEVTEKGDVLLTPENRFSDNSNGIVTLGVEEIINYYDKEGKLIRTVNDESDKKAEEKLVIPVEDEKEEAPKQETKTTTKTQNKNTRNKK